MSDGPVAHDDRDDGRGDAARSSSGSCVAAPSRRVRAVRFEGGATPAPGVVERHRRVRSSSSSGRPTRTCRSIPSCASTGCARRMARKPVVALSPIVGGAAIKGPLATMIRDLTGRGPVAGRGGAALPRPAARRWSSSAATKRRSPSIAGAGHVHGDAVARRSPAPRARGPGVRRPRSRDEAARLGRRPREVAGARQVAPSPRARRRRPRTLRAAAAGARARRPRARARSTACSSRRAATTWRARGVARGARCCATTRDCGSLAERRRPRARRGGGARRRARRRAHGRSPAHRAARRRAPCSRALDDHDVVLVRDHLGHHTNALAARASHAPMATCFGRDDSFAAHCAAARAAGLRAAVVDERAHRLRRRRARRSPASSRRARPAAGT